MICMNILGSFHLFNDDNPFLGSLHVSITCLTHFFNGLWCVFLSMLLRVGLV